MFELCAKSHEDSLTAEAVSAALQENTWRGVGFCEHVDHPEQLDFLHRVGETVDIPVFKGVRINEENGKTLKDKISLFREHVDVVAVEDTQVKYNRLAVEDARVDVLLLRLDRKHATFDHVLAVKAAENNAAIAPLLQPVIRGKGRKRVYALQKLERYSMLAEKYGVDFLPTLTPSKPEHVVPPGHITELLQRLGCSKAFTETMWHTGEHIVNRAAKRRGKGFVLPGVEVVG